MLKEERKKTAGPLRTMSWITYPVELDRQSQKNHLAQNAKIGTLITVQMSNMSVKNVDAIGIQKLEKS